ncbi:MAG TPA: hypothetical protein VNF47_06360 [Streptosporangiaceae bacterium]|nr:hypothetical protein [Streptosporangiaceae bacterium]
MQRLNVVARGLPRSAVLLMTAVLVLAGCKSNGTSGSGGPSGSAAPTTSVPASSSPSAPGGASGSALFPVAVGNTWVYNDTLGATQHGTTTDSITAVTPAANGQRVTITTHSDIPGLPATPTELSYVFFSDGSIGVPFAQIGNGEVTVKSGSIVWPSKAILDSGQPHTSLLVVRIKTAGHAITAQAHVTVQGGGTRTVTVPAGTYQATLVSQTIAVRVAGITVTIKVKTWLAPGIGPVKSEASTQTGSVSELVSLEVLKSFTQG